MNLLSAENDFMIRQHISDLTGIAMTTVYENLETLRKKGLVKKYKGKKEGVRGRPNIFWKVSE